MSTDALVLGLMLIAAPSGAQVADVPRPESSARPPTVHTTIADDHVTVSVRNEAKVDLLVWHVDLVFKHLSGDPVHMAKDNDHAATPKYIWQPGQGPIKPGETREEVFAAREVGVVESARVDVAFFEDLTFIGDEKQRDALTASLVEQTSDVEFWMRALDATAGVDPPKARSRLEGQLVIWERDIVSHHSRHEPGFETAVQDVLKRTTDTPQHLAPFLSSLSAHLKEVQARLTRLRPSRH
jgi:hypothetical protein